MRRLDRRGEAALFAVLVLGIGLASSLLGGRFVEPYGWIPLAAAVVVVLLTGRARSRTAWSGFAVRWAGFAAWIPAIAIPGVVLTAGYVAAWAFGAVKLGLDGISVPVYAGMTIVILVGASIEAIGEEVGWRGFLLPRLAGLGRVRAGFIGGLLWAAWHTPLIYVAGAYHGGADPLFMVPFTITIVAMGFIANELRIASGSSWPAVVFHGAHNGIWFQLQVLVVGSTGALGAIGGESGLVPMTLYVLVAVWIVARRPAWTGASDVRLGEHHAHGG
ncbi:MAG: type II CAAX prenyl endopeptidase Rce1 family protein [Candidatus Limnocylindrales bacterium]